MRGYQGRNPEGGSQDGQLGYDVGYTLGYLGGLAIQEMARQSMQQPYRPTNPGWTSPRPPYRPPNFYEPPIYIQPQPTYIQPQPTYIQPPQPTVYSQPQPTVTTAPAPAAAPSPPQNVVPAAAPAPPSNTIPQAPQRAKVPANQVVSLSLVNNLRRDEVLQLTEQAIDEEVESFRNSAEKLGLEPNRVENDLRQVAATHGASADQLDRLAQASRDGDGDAVANILKNQLGVDASVAQLHKARVESSKALDDFQRLAAGGASKTQLDRSRREVSRSLQSLWAAEPNSASKLGISMMADELERRAGLIGRLAEIRDISSGSIDPFTGPGLTGGPILIVSNPALPSDATALLWQDVVLVGTGGDGSLNVETGQPSDIGVPIVDGRPVDEAAPDSSQARRDLTVIVMNPPETGGSTTFLIEGTQYSLQPGESVTKTGRTSWIISFDRGGSFGPARYKLTPETYAFRVTDDKGWDLRRKTFEITLDNSENSNDFHYVLDNTVGVVRGGAKATLTSKWPILLTFDRGNGDVAIKELTEGTFSVGVDADEQLLDIFPTDVHRSLAHR
ncbi:hypothetical protein [Tautonia marina]|uniref:hypothetical protein n=1 Tax=Tautonia marina TaxID=2653855 RepID=UPI00137545FF|nr:hypothetical protein [Tautonia marina]